MRMALALLVLLLILGLAGRMDKEDALRQEARIACQNHASYIGIESQCIEDYLESK